MHYVKDQLNVKNLLSVCLLIPVQHSMECSLVDRVPRQKKGRRKKKG